MSPACQRPSWRDRDTPRSPAAAAPEPVRVVSTAPYRPRARVLSPPPSELDARGRILVLTGALSDREPPRTLTLEAEEAADALLDQLRAWGYLDGPPP